jgi:hypothetical protein
LQDDAQRMLTAMALARSASEPLGESESIAP